MKIVLLENQVELIMKSLQEFSKTSDKKQLIYSTYESLQYQLVKNQAAQDNKIVPKNVTQM